MISISQRLISLFMYMLPWSSALTYGNNIFNNYPILKLLILPTWPIFFIIQSIPFGDFIFFLFLFLGIARNQNIPYFIRLNTMQSILLHLIIVIFNYFDILLSRLYIDIFIIESLETIIFISTLTIIIFASIQTLRGIETNIPGISDSAKMQIS